MTQTRAGTAVDTDLVLVARGMTKLYGGVLALHDVDFDLRAGEVHAVVGENGAGKSTLIKCLSGGVRPDGGTIRIGDEEVTSLSPTSAQGAGVAVVHQELSLFPALTVAENVLGARGTGGPLVNWRRTRRTAAETLARVGLDLDPRARLDQLPIGQQQLVEIARALFSGARVIILDEPTSSLSPDEVELLFGFVHELAGQGVAFVLITHFLEDVMAHADRVTVLRNGSLVTCVERASVSKHDLVEAMIGDSSSVLQATYEGLRVTLPPTSEEPAALTLRGIVLPPAVVDMSFEVRRGEVVGIYGDLAAGHAEAAEFVFGGRKASRGELLIDGVSTVLTSTTKARAHGVAFIPADRREALALEQPISWNSSLAHLHKLTGFFLRSRHERAHLAKWTEVLRIRGVQPHKTAGALSGGNQQKVLFARWLEYPPKVMVVVEPTRGMDVGAKSDVVRIVREAARQGTAVLLVSSEPETVLTFADRILVAHRGRIVREFTDTQVSKNELMAAGHDMEST
jgi:ribose transport system ATP-binding protein